MRVFGAGNISQALLIPNFLSGKEKKHVAQFKFGDRDLRVIGALDAGQYSTASEVDKIEI